MPNTPLISCNLSAIIVLRTCVAYKYLKAQTLLSAKSKRSLYLNNWPPQRSTANTKRRFDNSPRRFDKKTRWVREKHQICFRKRHFELVWNINRQKWSSARHRESKTTHYSKHQQPTEGWLRWHLWLRTT